MIGRVISAILTIVIVAIITFTMHAAPVFAQTLIQPPRIEFCDLTKKPGSRCIQGDKVYASLSKDEVQFVRTKLLKIKPNSSKEEISALLQAELLSESPISNFSYKGKMVAIKKMHWLERRNVGQDIIVRIKKNGQISISYINNSIYQIKWIKQTGSWSLTIDLLDW